MLSPNVVTQHRNLERSDGLAEKSLEDGDYSL
jgi:hypothetical protein